VVFWRRLAGIEEKTKKKKRGEVLHSYNRGLINLVVDKDTGKNGFIQTKKWGGKE